MMRWCFGIVHSMYGTGALGDGGGGAPLPAAFTQSSLYLALSDESSAV